MLVPVQSTVLLALLASGASASNSHHKRSSDSIRSVPFLSSRGSKDVSSKQSAASAKVLGSTLFSSPEKELGKSPAGLQKSLEHISNGPKESVLDHGFMSKLFGEGLAKFRSEVHVSVQLDTSLQLSLRAEQADAVNDTAVTANQDTTAGTAEPDAAAEKQSTPDASAEEPAAPAPAAAPAANKEAAPATKEAPPAAKGGASPTMNSTVGVDDARKDKTGLRDLAALVNPFIGTKANSNPGNVSDALSRSARRLMC